MSNDLFIYPKKMPKYVEELPMYATAPSKSASPDDPEIVRKMQARVAKFARAFAVTSAQQDMGDIVLHREKDFSLEMYKASDSLWWTHNELAYREKVPVGRDLPNETEAAAAAARYLRQFNLSTTHAKKRGVEYTEVATSRGVQSRPRLARTEVHVIYDFSLDGLPVIGPGAKIKVSLVEDSQLSSLLYFWRNVVKQEPMRLVHPEEAVKRLSNDPRFMRLAPNQAVVKFENVRFAYYALPPDEFQRYLIPVYAVSGTWSTEFLQDYAFTYHVVAVEMTPDVVKKAGIVADPKSCQVF